MEEMEGAGILGIAFALKSQGLSEEFKHYLSQAVVHLKYDPIFYCQEQKNTTYHPSHSKAMMYLSIVGSSVPCECAFFRLPATS
ncbi:hypothetical protein TNCV_1604341 [Trichonephila clavipes]|nr:hypothetical protein TNCV_1604341 [Trichonephila clavipes]